jgi:hypothetical protein
MKPFWCFSLNTPPLENDDVNLNFLNGYIDATSLNKKNTFPLSQENQHKLFLIMLLETTF